MNDNRIEMVTIRSEGSIFWNGKEWKPKRGTNELTLPLVALEQIEAHHYSPQHQYIGGASVPSHRVKFERVEQGGVQ